ncbi:hypothetical protein DCAR_0208925 [Daucus carota subsp. sativus]|uniref:Uncharacterized protein n=1 Tax=Daucus carota subsp. sativus TaxID=79200 RepID=A0A166EWF6_DAUCS|nr:hypothetical protein DCAR_0208925 [Daucus carota subsp. sativus]
MSSEEASSNQGGDDVIQPSSQPKIIAADATTEPIVESSKQDKDVINPVPSKTKLTHHVVEPMSRGKFKFTGVDSVDLSEVSKCGWCCVGLCTCCTACCACLLCLPCLAVSMVLNCLMCPVNAAIACCCPSRAQPITIRIEDFKSFQSLFD